MKNTINFFLTLFAILIVSQSYLSAKVVEVRFLALENSGKEVYLLNAKGGFRSLALQSYIVTPYEEAVLDEDNKLSFYEKVTTPDGEEFVIIATAQAPKAMNKGFSLFVAYSEEDKLKVFDDSIEAFPAQSFRMINTTPVNVYSMVGEEKIELPPFSSKVVPVVHKSKRPIAKVLTVYKSSSGKWISFYNKPTAVLPQSRITGIALVSQGGLAKSMGVNQDVTGDEPAQAKAEFFMINENVRNLMN